VSNLLATGAIALGYIILAFVSNGLVRAWEWDRMWSRRLGDPDPQKPPWWCFLLGS